MPFKSEASHRIGLPTVLTLCLLIGFSGCKSEKTKQEEAYRERYAKAEALFKERCKTAGVVIHRTVKDVDGIELTKVRQPVPWGGKEYFDPMWPEAAMAGEYRGDDYINQFLMTELIDTRDPERRGSLAAPDFDAGSARPRYQGYRFVEIVDPTTKQRLRAQFDSHPPGTNLWGKAPRTTPISESATRFALDYEDIVDSADRQYWVAGTVLKVVDKKTGDVIAKLTRYVWDPGFGVSTTGRWPWVHAARSGPTQMCPHIPGTSHSTSRKFVDTVLIPKQGD